MLDQIFMRVLDMSIASSLVILAVCVIRLFLKKTPKVYAYALWAVVLFRLLCPVSIQSPVTVLPALESVSESYSLADESISFAGASEAAYQAVGDALNGGLGIQHIRTTQTEADGSVLYATSYWWEVWILFGQYVWLLGIGIMALHGIRSHIKLKQQLVGAVPVEGNLYLADHIPSPFVMGIFRPKIYLPSSLPASEQPYIIAHERHHIARLDHITRLLSYLALVIHWFNPLVWLALRLSGQDMEMSCDEAVVSKLGANIRSEYAASLLSLSTGRQTTLSTPLAFGEEDPKGRIRNLARWKKPAKWLCAAAAALIVLATAVLITDPVSRSEQLWGSNYTVTSLIYSAELPESNLDYFPKEFSVTADYHLYRRKQVEEGWEYLGKLESYPLTNEELEQYTPSEDSWHTRHNFSSVTDAHILRLEDGGFYLLFKTSNGKSYIGYGWEDLSERNQPGSDDTRLQLLGTMEANMGEGDFSTGFFARSLYASVGADVDPFHHWSSDDYPNFAVVAFQSGEEMEDLGFGVFYTSDYTGYTLVYYQVYEDAARMDNGIYFCETPAVLTFDGKMRTDNSFDVILSINENLEEIVRTYHYDDQEDVTQVHHVGGFRSMILLPWSDSHNCDSISQYYIAKDGSYIEDYGIGPTEDTTPVEEQDVPNATWESWSCAQWDYTGITMIRLTNAHNGKQTFITEPDALSEIISFLQKVEGTDVESAKGYYEGSYSLAFYRDDTILFSVGFGDSPSIYCGSYEENYPCRYTLKDLAIEEVIDFLSQYDSSGFVWD